MALVLGAGGGLADGDGPPRASATPRTLPAGAGREIAARACLMCHSAMLITQQAKDSTGWEKTLGTMQKWGAPLSVSDHDALRGYLLSHFGPRATH